MNQILFRQQVKRAIKNAPTVAVAEWLEKIEERQFSLLLQGQSSKVQPIPSELDRATFSVFCNTPRELLEILRLSGVSTEGARELVNHEQEYFLSAIRGGFSVRLGIAYARSDGRFSLNCLTQVYFRHKTSSRSALGQVISKQADNTSSIIPIDASVMH